MNKLLHEIVNYNIKKKHNKIVLKYCNNSITYKELGIKSTQIMDYLILQGIKKRDVVCMKLTNPINIIISH